MASVPKGKALLNAGCDIMPPLRRFRSCLPQTELGFRVLIAVTISVAGDGVHAPQAGVREIGMHTVAANAEAKCGGATWQFRTPELMPILI